MQERGFGGGEVFGVHRHDVDAFLAIHEETAAHPSGGLEPPCGGQDEKIDITASAGWIGSRAKEFDKGSGDAAAKRAVLSTPKSDWLSSRATVALAYGRNRFSSSSWIAL